VPKSVFFKRKELPLCVLMENKQPVGRAAMPKKWQTAHTKGKFERAWISSALFEVVVCMLCHAWFEVLCFPGELQQWQSAIGFYVGRLRRAND
jgi:hypothetical protein